MKHLHRYAQPKRAKEVQTVEVIDADHVCFKGSRYDLRTTEKVQKQPGFGVAPDGGFLE